MALLTVGRLKSMLKDCDDSLILQFKVTDLCEGTEAVGEVEDSADGISLYRKSGVHVGEGYPDVEVLRIELEVD